MNENIEELSHDFACKLLDKPDNSMNCRDNLDVVEFACEKMVMMPMDNRNFRSINLNRVMQLLDQEVMTNVSMLPVVWWFVSVVEKFDFVVVEVVDHEWLKLIGWLN